MMKKIVFVHPPMTRRRRHGNLGVAGARTPPFGICYLAAVVRERGYRALIVDAEALELSDDETADQVLSQDPDYVGFTATTPNFASAARVARRVKEFRPSIRILIGGCHVTALPEEALRSCPEFDIAVLGEGENTILELLHDLDQGKDPGSVAGLALRRGDRVVLTPPRPLIKDLDALPLPAFDLLLPLDKYYCPNLQTVDRLPAVSLFTSRGCCGKCTFCDTSVTGRTIRPHGAAYVLRMVRELKERYGVRCMVFEDDNFLALRKRIEEMASGLRDLDMTWSCASRVDLADAGVLKLARRLGCWQVHYGVESGSQRILDFFKKGITLEQTARAIDMSKEAGLHAKGFIMIGNPLETLETLEETRLFTLQLALDDVTISYFTPFPGAPVYGVCEEYGTFERDWERMTSWEVLFVPHDLTKEILEDYQRRIFREFYCRLPIIAGYIGRIRTPRHLIALTRSALALTEHVLTRPLLGIR